FFDKGPKFLRYHPQEIIMTSLEFDHADIYPDLPAIELQFQRLVNLVPRSGRIVAWGDNDPLTATIARATQKAFARVETYGLDGSTDWIAGDMEFAEEATHFRVAHRGAEVARVRLPLAGKHNVLNALAACAIAAGRDVPRAAIEEALGTFRSVRRRLQVLGEPGGVMVVDDFAHHPTAIRATIDAARTRWAGRRIWAIFEPRSNTMRRNVLEEALGDALGRADGVLLGSVNRANLLREAERLSPERVVSRVRRMGRTAEAMSGADEIADYLESNARAGDVILVMSNGSFDGLCSKLLTRLGARRKTLA
ncbi:MAG: glutamate ligase domain-containing protein, partial [Bryobacteraceae bacterium]